MLIGGWMTNIVSVGVYFGSLIERWALLTDSEMESSVGNLTTNLLPAFSSDWLSGRIRHTTLILHSSWLPTSPILAASRLLRSGGCWRIQADHWAYELTSAMTNVKGKCPTHTEQQAPVSPTRLRCFPIWDVLFLIPCSSLVTS